jgi:hypothetical protein
MAYEDDGKLIGDNIAKRKKERKKERQMYCKMPASILI